MSATKFRPLLPWKRPIWMLVLSGMLVFGFYQEMAKVHLNHYLDALTQHPEADVFDPLQRAEWWDTTVHPRRLQYYIIEETWSGFHQLSIDELVMAKWGLTLFVLLLFFVFDGLFLKTTGHFDRWPWLLILYAISGAVILVFALIPGRTAYGVVHEFLAFLQSPLPSLFIVLVPTLLERMQSDERRIRDCTP